MVDNKDMQRPEGRLIDEARKKIRPPLSGREAASRAGISEGRWRQIITGFQSTTGVRIPVTAPAVTLARMASVVGVTPDELQEAGRGDAAAELKTIAADQPHLRKTFIAEDSAYVAYSVPSDASEEQVQRGVNEVLAWALRMAEAAGNVQRADQIRRIIAGRGPGEDDPDTEPQQ